MSILFFGTNILRSRTRDEGIIDFRNPFHCFVKRASFQRESYHSRLVDPFCKKSKLQFNVQTEKIVVEMDALLEQTENLITENASVAMDQAVYAERYGKLVGEYKAKNAEFDQHQSEIADKKAREVQIQNFIRRVRELDTFVTEFDKGLWSDMVDFMTVYKDKTVKVTFKDGTEI